MSNARWGGLEVRLFSYDAHVILTGNWIENAHATKRFALQDFEWTTVVEATTRRSPGKNWAMYGMMCIDDIVNIHYIL